MERAILLMADADGCLGGLHGRGWTGDHANRIAQTLGVPVNGEFSEVIDNGLLRQQWPSGMSWAQRNPAAAWFGRIVGAVALITLVLELSGLVSRWR